MTFRNQEKIHNKNHTKKWADKRIGITGASGSLGISLSKEFKSKGAYVIGLTHQQKAKELNLNEGPNQWVQWSCGKENELSNLLDTLDVLILNHGVNPGGNLNAKALENAIEINALSQWRLIEIFTEISLKQINTDKTKELWINTSEAEIQPAFSPSYEISKRLIGQMISFKYSSLTKDQHSKLKIKKIILGPFQSKLNPIGIMNPDSVARKIINKSIYSSKLIIISPNPLTYILMPIAEISREIYFYFFKDKKN